MVGSSTSNSRDGSLQTGPAHVPAFVLNVNYETAFSSERSVLDARRVLHSFHGKRLSVTNWRTRSQVDGNQEDWSAERVATLLGLPIPRWPASLPSSRPRSGQRSSASSNAARRIYGRPAGQRGDKFTDGPRVRSSSWRRAGLTHQQVGDLCSESRRYRKAKRQTRTITTERSDAKRRSRTTSRTGRRCPPLQRPTLATGVDRELRREDHAARRLQPRHSGRLFAVLRTTYEIR